MFNRLHTHKDQKAVRDLRWEDKIVKTFLISLFKSLQQAIKLASKSATR